MVTDDLIKSFLTHDEELWLSWYQSRDYTPDEFAEVLKKLVEIPTNNIYYSQALNLRAYIYYHGYGVAFDSELALGLFDQAVKLKNKNALYHRALIYYSGEFGSKDTAKAIELLDEAVKLKHSKAIYLRANMYRQGEGQDVDLEMAISLLQEAILLGNDEAMNSLGYFYSHGIGVPCDYQMALDLFNQAITINPSNAQAFTNIAFIYSNGDEKIAKDISLAIDYNKRAVDLNDKTAMANLALLYYEAAEKTNDYGPAIDLLERAILLKSASAMCSRAYMLTKIKCGPIDYQRAINLYECSIALGDTHAMYHLAKMYEEGEYLPKDVEKASELYLQAYQKNKNKHAFQALTKLADQNHPQAQLNLIILRLKEKQRYFAQNILQQNPHQLMPLLYKKLIYFFDNPPIDVELMELFAALIEPHINILNELDCSYLQFKLACYWLKQEELLNLYYCVLYKEPRRLSGYEWFYLGNAELASKEGLNENEKRRHIYQACYFLYQGAQKGDKDCYQLCVKLLRELENNSAKEAASSFHALGIIAEDKDNQSLINRFLEQRRSLIAEEVIVVLNTLVSTLSYQMKARRKINFTWIKNTIFSNSELNTINMAKDLINHLQQHHTLERIFCTPYFLLGLAREKIIYKLLKPYLNNAIHQQIVDIKECQDLLKKKNGGQFILEMLMHKPLTPKAFRYLLDCKSTILEYIKSIDKESQQAISKEIWQKNDSSLYHFFHTPKNLTTPSVHKGSLKKISTFLN